MPPKRKARIPAQIATTSSEGNAEEIVPSPDVDANNKSSVLSDPWTDEQETSLFKGMISWKPVGAFL